MELQLNKPSTNKPAFNQTTLPTKIRESWKQEYFMFLLNEKEYSSGNIANHLTGATYFLTHITELAGLTDLNLEDLVVIKLHHLESFENQLSNRKETNEISVRTYYSYRNQVKKFIEFLNKKDIVTFQYTLAQASTNRPDYLEDFKQYLISNNYATTTIGAHIGKLKQIYIDLINCSQLQLKTLHDCSSINAKVISDYEQLLNKRISDHKIKRTSAYSCLKAFRLFLHFLNHKKIINFKYNIPSSFVVQPNRSNSYADEDSIIKLVEIIMQKPSELKYRNLALLLLIVDTGCRIIEASNVKLCDLSLTRKTIVFHCVKSGQRTIKLNEMVIQAMKDYLVIRSRLNPKTDHLFINIDGQPSNNHNLSSILSNANKEAFNAHASIASARPLRHTFITNAIENKNNINDTANAVGHKHVQSTYGYLHRSKDRLLNNTLQHNPMELVFGSKKEEQGQ